MQDGNSGAADSVGPNELHTVFTVVFENHDFKEIVGSANAPYLNSLIAQYGLATNYNDSGMHPSLPNYLYMVSGAIQYPGHIDINPDWRPYFPSPAKNLGEQLTESGFSWRSYQESMGKPCRLDEDDNYAPKHNPFVYFRSIQKGDHDLCSKTNVDYSQFKSDLASGAYRYMWITPNLINDGHQPADDPQAGLQQTDAWCKSEIPNILNSQAFQTGGVLFLTWDEAEGRNGDSKDQVPMIIVSPKIRRPGYSSKTLYNHASYLATVEDIFHLPRLGAAVQASAMFEFFRLEDLSQANPFIQSDEVCFW